jgi:proliferating cell nuclear antigen PCNA
MNLMNIQTVQTSVFKNMFEALKDIFREINLIVDVDGISAQSINDTHTVLTKVDLPRDRFESYECRERMYLGLDMDHFYKIIKTISNSEILTLFVLEERRNELGIRVMNPDLNTITTYKLKLMDISVNNIDLPHVDFETEISLYSVQFQKLIKEMNTIAKCVEIRAIGDEVIFSCKGLFTERETIIKENEKGMKICKPLRESSIVQCVFLLKMLTTFTKCTALSPIVDLKLKNDFALVIQYNVGSLGTIELILSNYAEDE